MKNAKNNLMKGTCFAILFFIVFVTASYAAQTREFHSFEPLIYGITAVGSDSLVTKDDYKELLSYLKNRDVAESPRFQRKLLTFGNKVKLTSQDVMILYFAALDEQMQESLLKEFGEDKVFHFEYAGKGSFGFSPGDARDCDNEE